MKDTRREFRYFMIPDWVEEQDYLRQMHGQGWKFVRVNGLCIYHFVRCQPEDVVYQLDYNKEGTAHRMEYIRMFEDCGWEYLQDYVGYSYFRKPASEMHGDEEIFCDDASRRDMMKRVLKGRMLPLLFILLFCILPQIWIQYQNGAFVMMGVFGAFLVLYLIVFIRFARKFAKRWKDS